MEDKRPWIRIGAEEVRVFARGREFRTPRQALSDGKLVFEESYRLKFSSLVKRFIQDHPNLPHRGGTRLVGAKQTFRRHVVSGTWRT